jgi:hypothetical protein
MYIYLQYDPRQQEIVCNDDQSSNRIRIDPNYFSKTTKGNATDVTKPAKRNHLLAVKMFLYAVKKWYAIKNKSSKLQDLSK